MIDFLDTQMQLLPTSHHKAQLLCVNPLLHMHNLKIERVAIDVIHSAAIVCGLQYGEIL